MGRFGSFIHDNPFKVLLVLVLLLAFPISHLPQIKMDTSTEGFMHKKDPVLLAYNEFRDQFGRDERIALAIKSDKIFTLEFLTTLKELHKELESTVPFVDEVTSLYNVRNTRGEGDKLITDDLLEPFPTTQAQLDSIKEHAMKSEFYKDLLISKDGTMTTLMIETDAYSHENDKEVSDIDAFDEAFEDETSPSTAKAFLTDKENAQVVRAVLAIADTYKEKGLEIYVAGSPSVNHALKTQMKADMQKFMRFTFLIILVFLL